jgi:hypothetical protein
MHIREGSLYIVAATRSNANPTMVFQYLYKLVEIFKAYFGQKFDAGKINKNLPLVYELMDETMDFGYPQTCSVDVLKLFINTGKQMAPNSVEASNLSSQITGAVDWRGENVIHRKNEVFIDVMESIHTLVSSQGKALSMEVNGKVIMKAHLSGMPECKFGLNDKGPSILPVCRPSFRPAFLPSFPSFRPPVLPSSLFRFLHSFLAFLLPSFRPSVLLSFFFLPNVPSLRPAFLPSVCPSVFASFLSTVLPSSLPSVFSFRPSLSHFLPSFLSSVLPYLPYLPSLHHRHHYHH